MSVPRILIVKLSSLGDVLHALPTVAALRAQLGAEIDWAVQPEYAELVACFPDVTRVIVVPRRRWWVGLPRTLAALRASRYDMVIDLQGLFKSGVVAGLAHAPRRIGPSYARECAGLFYTERAGRADTARHAVEQAMDVLDHLKLQRPAHPAAAIRFTPARLEGARPRIGILPVSRWPTKNWPAAHFAKLSARLVRDLGATVYVLGAADVPVGDEIVRLAGEGTSNRCGRQRLPDLFGVLDQLDLVIACDTGPVHMAAALGRRCLVLFGPTRPDRTGPYGEGHRVLMRDLPCQPCLSRRCRVGGQPCLALLTPETVFEAARVMLSQGCK